MNKSNQIEKMKPKEIKELVDLLVDYGRNYDDSLHGCEDIVAELIVTNGYRKSSEVVEDIVAEVVSIVSRIVTEHIGTDNSIIETEVDIINALVALENTYKGDCKC